MIAVAFSCSDDAIDDSGSERNAAPVRLIAVHLLSPGKFELPNIATFALLNHGRGPLDGYIAALSVAWLTDSKTHDGSVAFEHDIIVTREAEAVYVRYGTLVGVTEIESESRQVVVELVPAASVSFLIRHPKSIHVNSRLIAIADGAVAVGNIEIEEPRDDIAGVEVHGLFPGSYVIEFSWEGGSTSTPLQRLESGQRATMRTLSFGW